MSVGSASSGAHDIYLHAEEIRDVERFYRRLSLVAGAAATDLRAHEFGAWTSDGHVDHADLRDRYRSMAELLADRLDVDGTRAGSLADGFATTLAAVADADAEADTFDAGDRSVDGSVDDPGGGLR